MLASTLRFALRRLGHERGYTAIHVAGLAVGVAACLLILLYLQHELGYDRFHPDVDRTVRVVAEDTERSEFGRSLPGHVAGELADRIPEVEAATAIERNGDEMLVEVSGERSYVDGFASVSPSFFDVLAGFEALAGDPAEALRQPDGAVLTRTLAERLFGSPAAAVGQTVTTLDESLLDVDQMEAGRIDFAERGSVAYTVRAVVEDPPTRSTVQFALLVPLVDTGFRGWNVSGAEVYLRLRPGVDLPSLDAKLAAYVRDHAFYGGERSSPIDDLALHLQPLADVHLTPDIGADVGTGPRQYLGLFAVAALLILLIASANYVNLATTRAIRRAREVGVRKTVGASRAQLWGQFVAEAAVVVLAALAVGLVLAGAALPWVSSVLGADLSLRSFATPAGVGVLGLLFVGVVVGSGFLPAVVLTRFRPVAVLKGAPTSSGSGRWLRRGLVLFQFGTSATLVLATLGVSRQMDYVREARLDALDSQVVVVENPNAALAGGYDSFKQDLLADAAVASVSTGAPPSGDKALLFNALREGGDPVMLNLVFAGRDYVETLGLHIVEGAGLDAPPPPSADRPVLINEAAVAASDLAALPTPVGALDTKFNGGDVVGVVEDYHFESLHQPIGPLAILPTEDVQSQILVRLRAGRIADGLAAVQTVWDRYVPDRPLQYAFLDEALDASYATELRMTGLFRAFALLAIAVAAMGLFGLAAYTAEMRTKEVGVRKVLGASVVRLVGLLSREFAVLVLVAFGVGIPLAILFLRCWLDGFAYHVEPGLGLVASAGGLVLLVALLTVGAQAYRAATADPVRALRSE